MSRKVKPTDREKIEPMTDEQAKEIADELRLKQGLGVPLESVSELVLYLYDRVQALEGKMHHLDSLNLPRVARMVAP